MFDAATHFETPLPELYCGFERRAGEPPLAIPSLVCPKHGRRAPDSCFCSISWHHRRPRRRLFGVLPKHANALAGTVRIDRPEMPADLGHLPLRGLAVGDARIDIAFERVGQRVAATPLGTVPDSVEVLVRV